MSASEIIFAAGAAAVGVAVGSFAIYLYTSAGTGRKAGAESPAHTMEIEKPTEEKKEAGGNSDNAQISSQLLGIDQSRSIPRSELEKSKRELRTLIVEKELVSAALTRLYEAEAAKEITKSERELLGAKYVTELKSLDDKIVKMDAFIQIGDLETLRNQLLQLVEEKIDAIEKRIESTKKLAEPLIAEMMSKQGSSPQIIQPATVDETQRGTPIPDISDMLQNERPEPRIDPVVDQQPIATKVSAPKESPKAPVVSMMGERKRPSDKVEELQREILEALDRLERLDVDSA